ncbi:MAG: FKBP-type peptidyl-prolyl cis-trans isomerase [Oligoflexus sp.]
MKKTFLIVATVSMSALFSQSCTCDREVKETSTEETSTEGVTELKIVDVQEGNGAEAVSGKTVVVHYRGTFLDGRPFDSSHDRGEPFTFQLGADQVIQGWDQGVVGMKEGGTRKLTIPSELAYGERGAGQVIPPNTPLEFEIQLLEVRD